MFDTSTSTHDSKTFLDSPEILEVDVDRFDVCEVNQKEIIISELTKTNSQFTII